MSISHKRLEKKRHQALLDIQHQRTGFEEMLQRASASGEVPNPELVANVRARFADIASCAAVPSVSSDELDALLTDAEYQGQMEAYVCPGIEIADEAKLCVDEMEEWNIPKTVITKLRTTLVEKCKPAPKDVAGARSALRALFEERDSWDGYTSEYEDTMRHYAWWLFGTTLGALILGIVAIRTSKLFLGGLLLVGLAGSCVSVLTKMPLLDVTLAGELQAYQRRILSRVGIGVTASLIGCALLEWGLFSVAIQGQTFADLLGACSSDTVGSCSNSKTLVVAGISALFGLSERALGAFERRLFGR